MKLAILPAFIGLALTFFAKQFGEMTTLDNFGGPSSGNYNPTAAKVERITSLRQARFGTFIHWGLYSKLAGYWKVHVLNWPKDGKLALPALKETVTRSRLLADPTAPVKFEQSPDKLVLTLPANAPDPVASVICLSL